MYSFWSRWTKAEFTCIHAPDMAFRCWLFHSFVACREFMAGCRCRSRMLSPLRVQVSWHYRHIIIICWCGGGVSSGGYRLHDVRNTRPATPKDVEGDSRLSRKGQWTRKAGAMNSPFRHRFYDLGPRTAISDRAAINRAAVYHDDGFKGRDMGKLAAPWRRPRSRPPMLSRCGYWLPSGVCRSSQVLEHGSASCRIFSGLDKMDRVLREGARCCCACLGQ